jgi:crotonobetainyl-CoA:carnitine CoA-transferase CaiB-like acyl-CoA transferase
VPVVSTAGGPMAGVRVLDFSQAWAGPLCTRTLADLGADVLKVESRSVVDVSRTLGPFLGEPGPDSSGYFLEWNRGKRSISIDLKSRDGRDAAVELAKSADVVVENFAPGVMDRLEIGYPKLREVKPDLIMLSISGFGSTGPASRHVAFGQQIEAVSGLMSLMTYEDGHPTKTGISWSDPLAGFFGALTVLAALESRDATGHGEWIEVSMLEASLATMLKPFALRACGSSPADSFKGGHHPDFVPFGVFATAGENSWLAIECRTDDEWGALADLAGRGWGTDQRFSSRRLRVANRRLLHAEVETWTRSRDSEGLAAALQGVGVPAHALSAIDDLLDDAHLAERRFWIDTDHPVVGRFKTAGTGIPIDADVRDRLLAPPLLGSSTGWEQTA